MDPTEAVLRELLDSAPDALIICSASGRIVYANHAAEGVFGWPRGDLLGRSVDVLVPPSSARQHPNLRARYMAEPTRRPMGAGLQLHALRRDGSEFPAEISLNTIDVPSGRLVAAAIRDVAEARETETKLRALLAGVPDAIVGVDSTGTIALVNDRAELLFGWSSEDLIGRKIEVLVPRPARQRHQDHRALYLRNPVPRPMGLGTELLGLRKDGSTFPAEISLSSVDHGTAGVLVLAAVRDITERILESERTQLQRAESHRMESLGQLAGGIAHDFNNLLGVILNYATLAARHIEDPIAVADLGEIRAAAELGAGLTRQLLTFARREPVVSTVIDVAETVRGATWLLERTLGTDIQLVLDLCAPGVTAAFGRGQLEQILLNLALNSRAAMADGGTFTVKVTAIESDLGPGGVAVSVTDTGVGMTAAVAARAFEPLFSTRPAGQGTGLGLASVYGIVQQNRGHAAIRSAPGAGTTIDIVIPRSREPAAVSEDDLSQPLGNGERILVVEDETPLRVATSRLLTESGYSVIEAEDGREALDLLQSGLSVNLVVTDIAMPRMRGDQLAREIRERWPDLPVIFVTGNDYAPHLLDRPALSKPVDETDLLSSVRSEIDA